MYSVILKTFQTMFLPTSLGQVWDSETPGVGREILAVQKEDQ